jgi:hypothetical protein
MSKASDDFDRFINGVGRNVESVVMTGPKFMQSISTAIENMSSPLLLPILGVCVAIVGYKMLDSKK